MNIRCKSAKNKGKNKPQTPSFREGDQYIGPNAIPVPLRDPYWDGGRN